MRNGAFRPVTYRYMPLHGCGSKSPRDYGPKVSGQRSEVSGQFWCNGLFFNPKGIGSFSPALDRFREGLRWVAVRRVTTLKGLHINDLWKRYNPFRVWESCLLDPGWLVPPPSLRYGAASRNPGLIDSIPLGLPDSVQHHAELPLAFHRKQRRTNSGRRRGPVRFNYKVLDTGLLSML